MIKIMNNKVKISFLWLLLHLITATASSEPSSVEYEEMLGTIPKGEVVLKKSLTLKSLAFTV